MFGGIVLRDVPMDYRRPDFISMDQPKHDEQRKVVSAPLSRRSICGVCPRRCASARAACSMGCRATRRSTGWIALSIELTTQMLATLFDFPFEERRTLTWWSNVATVNTRAGTEINSEAKRDDGAADCTGYFTALWHERATQAPRPDLISMLAHGEATRDLPSRPHEFIGNMLLLLVGGNDTTRNSMSGGLWALNRYPRPVCQADCQSRDLISSLVPEIIRWQTPVMHMRRTALEDAALGGKTDQARATRLRCGIYPAIATRR